METINYNFDNGLGFIKISGDEDDKTYKIKFINSDIDVFSTNIKQNNWASSNKKTTNIKIYNDENLIFERDNDDVMNFNQTSINFIGSYKPEDLLNNVEDDVKNPLAIICPHAGYRFSGEIAAKSFSTIDKNKKYDNIFILSTSHTSSYKGASMCNRKYYNTPFGDLNINQELCEELNKNDIINFNNIHFKDDHTINVILPFIKERINPGYQIVPIMIGDRNIDNLLNISNILQPYLNDNNLFVISSDFSHYPSYDDALIVDEETKEAILSNNSDTFLNIIHNMNKEDLVTRMCGWSSYLILLYMIENKDIKINVEEYKNSGGDKVVGYFAMSFCEPQTINNDDKKYLTNVVRKTIRQYLDDGTTYEPIKPESQILNSNLGAFVTFHLDGNLRGCIGLFSANYELYKVVRDMSISSAFKDPRFSSITKNEYNSIDIEISVLTPFKKINDINEIILGKHGIYITKDGSSGTFLPQVATETGWSLLEYLGYCSKDKAGIGWEGWKDAEIYTYEADVFNEIKKDKEASYYKIKGNDIIECTLCPHNCIIKNGQYGICLSRKNEDGILYATSYNKLCSIAIDPIEKKPLRRFIPGTMTYSISAGGCNFKCLNCQNSGISQLKPEDVANYSFDPHMIIDEALKHGCPSISYTYTEPSTFYEMMIDTAKLAKKAGLKNVMVSNGYINEEPLIELCKYIDAFNIDLKSFSDKIYKKLNKGSLEPVLNTLKTIKENNCWLEITNLIIPGWTDNVIMVEEMYDWLVANGFSEYPVHFIGFFPTYKMMDTPRASNESIEIIKQIARKSGMKYI